ncbi:MAG: hypothetical protein ACOZCF_12415 [Bacillota bacterium]
MKTWVSEGTRARYQYSLAGKDVAKGCVATESGIAGHPAGLEAAAGADLLEKLKRDGGLGLEGEVFGHPALLVACRILGRKPALGQVEPAVHQAVALGLA